MKFSTLLYCSCSSFDCCVGASHLILLLLCVRITKRFRWCVADKTTSFFSVTINIIIYFWLRILFSFFRFSVLVISCKSHQKWCTNWEWSRKPTTWKRFHLNFLHISGPNAAKTLPFICEIKLFFERICGTFKWSIYIRMIRPRFLAAKHCCFNSGLIQFQIF